MLMHFRTLSSGTVVVPSENLTYIDTYNGTTTATLGTHVAGDVFIAWASRDGSSTAPSLPAGWTDITSGGTNSLGYRLSYKVAASAAETSGTHTNATSLQIVHVRVTSGWALLIGAVSTAVSSSATNLSCPALTLQNTDNTSRLFAFFAHRSGDITNLTSPPSGMTHCSTNQDATDTAAAYRVDGTASTWSTQTTTFGGTADTARWVVLELKLETESADTTPDAFTFSDQTGVALSSTMTSSPITVSGINTASPITVSGGSYDINASGSFVTSAGTVSNGDTVRARHTSSGSNATATNTTVTIGGISDTFTSTTLTGTTPDYTPLKMLWFDVGTPGAQAGGTSGFDAPQDTSVNGYPKYSTAIAGPYGGGQVCVMSWTAADRYYFGGDMFNGSHNVVDGDEMWVRQWLYVVPTYSWGDAGGGDSWGNTKWLRQWFTNGGDNCFQMNSSGKCFGMTTEGYSGAGANLTLNMGAMPAIPQGQWVCQEFYILFHSNASLGKIRYWQDGTYYGETTGVTKASGTSTVNRILHGDYWNGGSPQAQTWYIDEVIITFETPDATDAGGRPFIGTTRQVGDF